MSKDYAATREEWADKLRGSWCTSAHNIGDPFPAMADHMIAQGWLPVKEPEREIGWYLVEDGMRYTSALWWDGKSWYRYLKPGSHPVNEAGIEAQSATRLRPDSEAGK